MKQTVIPGTPLRVSAVCLGTAKFGGAISESDAFRLLDAFCDGGGRMIDTANVYGRAVDGTNLGERIIGRWLRRGGHDGVTVATKGGHFDGKAPSVSRVTREAIFADVEESLQTLGVPAIDLYWLHRDNEQRPAGEIIEFCEELVRAGKIRCYGASNWTLPRLQEAQAYAASHGCGGFCAVSNRFSLAYVPSDGKADGAGLVTTDEAFYRYHCETGFPLVPYSALAFGFFEKLACAGVTAADGRFESLERAGLPEHMLRELATPVNARRYALLRQIQAETGLSMTDLTVGYHTSQPFTDIPVVAVRTTEQLDALLHAGSLTLSGETIGRINALQPF